MALALPRGELSGRVVRRDRRGDRAPAIRADSSGETLGTITVGRDARPVSDVASELGSDSHAANRVVVVWGQTLLAIDCARVGAVGTLGLGETRVGRESAYRIRQWSTFIVDVTARGNCSHCPWPRC